MGKHRLLVGYILIYLLLNILFLTAFPFVHSDEPWLSGLSRNIAQSGDLSVTETFFDLKPRYPHAIKMLFHMLQIPFMAVFGYNVFAFRLLSLLFGAASLAMFYMLALRFTSQALAFIGTVALSLDIQFIYTTHFARPEIIILFCMLGVYALLTSSARHSALKAALLTGLSIGIHPNSFLVAALSGAMLASQSLEKRRVQWVDMAKYVGVVALFCGGFVALSYFFDADFIRHYLAYGSEFEVDSSLSAKLREIVPYFQRLFHRVSGTYYTPDIRPQLVLFGLAIPVGVAAALKLRDKNIYRPLFALLGILCGMTIVGRFSQPYVVLIFPFAYLLILAIAGKALARFQRRPKRALALAGGLACAISGSLAMYQVLPIATQSSQYNDYLSNIAEVVPAGAKTIANLNAEYHFQNGALLDYRNLAYLKENNLSVADYVRQNEVEYIVVSDELSFIHSRRPTWNGIYGNINYLDDLNAFLDEHCTLLKTFTDNQYGVRIVRYQNTIDFNIRIYRYNDS